MTGRVRKARSCAGNKDDLHKQVEVVSIWRTGAGRRRGSGKNPQAVTIIFRLQLGDARFDSGLRPVRPGLKNIELSFCFM
jgi:hypothetical protein